MLHKISITALLIFGSFCCLTQNTFAQSNDKALDTYVPPPLFGAPKLPPPKIKKPRIDVIPEISTPVDRVITPPRILNRISIPPKPKKKPIPKTNTIVLLSKEKKSGQQEPIDYLKKSAPKETIKSTGVVTGPKTMPSVKKTSVEIEHTYISDKPSENMIDRIQNDDTTKNQSIDISKTSPTIAFNPLIITDDDTQFNLAYNNGQIEPAEKVIIEILQPLSQILSQNDKIIDIKSYASALNGKVNSDRRIALDRGLHIREYLISKDIAAHRINLRSLGNQTEAAVIDYIEINLIN